MEVTDTVAVDMLATDTVAVDMVATDMVAVDTMVDQGDTDSAAMERGPLMPSLKLMPPLFPRLMPRLIPPTSTELGPTLLLPTMLVMDTPGTAMPLPLMLDTIAMLLLPMPAMGLIPATDTLLLPTPAMDTLVPDSLERGLLMPSLPMAMVVTDMAPPDMAVMVMVDIAVDTTVDMVYITADTDMEPGETTTDKFAILSCLSKISRKKDKNEINLLAQLLRTVLRILSFLLVLDCSIGLFTWEGFLDCKCNSKYDQSISYISNSCSPAEHFVLK